ncbi:hypothetical protein BS47DRAFT_1387653 [Hydnum rufescens UP504]|uniref:Uncharacterized protein n=1 Tax=Hydnum rufescens UP504 TaxID=1448309 RepID=A0A9P6B949_9AGAM|nr:hypothetical protein BS47DRAFT_1387653 [Hydnum rufescens UP504]
MEEENYQSMEKGNHQPVEEENHQPTEEENHQSIEEENQSADKDAPGGKGLTAQNVSKVGDEKNDHNDNSANKATDELTKMAVDDHALAHPQVTSQGSPGL